MEEWRYNATIVEYNAERIQSIQAPTSNLGFFDK